MADVLTVEELKGTISNKKIAWLGDGNNIVYSLIEAATQFNFQLAIACPQKFEPEQKNYQMGKKQESKYFHNKRSQRSCRGGRRHNDG